MTLGDTKLQESVVVRDLFLLVSFSRVDVWFPRRKYAYEQESTHIQDAALVSEQNMKMQCHFRCGIDNWST